MADGYEAWGASPAAEVEAGWKEGVHDVIPIYQLWYKMEN